MTNVSNALFAQCDGLKNCTVVVVVVVGGGGGGDDDDFATAVFFLFFFFVFFSALSVCLSNSKTPSSRFLRADRDETRCRVNYISS